MIKSQITYILKLASIFESFAIKKMCILAKLNTHNSFSYKLAFILNKQINKENKLKWDEIVDKWSEKNYNVLKDILGKNANVSKDYLDFFLGHNGSIPVWARISKTPNEPDNFDVQKSDLLLSEGEIPNLWLNVGKFVQSGLEKLNTDLGHNEFLYIALRELFPSEEITAQGDSFVNMVELFYRTYKDKINYLRKFFDGQPKKLGKGSDGIAFAISSTLVLKLFVDPFAFEQSKKSVNRLHKNPELSKTEAMIYDVGELGVFNNTPIYYYIIEKMKPVRSLDPDLQHYLKYVVGKIADIIDDEKDNKWRDIKNNIHKPEFHSEIKKEVIKASKNIFAMFNNPEDKEVILTIEKMTQPLLRKNWLESLIEEVIMKYLTGRTDLHMGNIGVTSYGDFRYFDPVYKDYESNIEISSGDSEDK